MACVYSWGGASSRAASPSSLVGERGAKLAELAGLGLPVPPGFVVTTEAFPWFLNQAHASPEQGAAIKADIWAAVRNLATPQGAAFGLADDPLLLAVRSSPSVPMPGTLDTVLNLGLNDATAAGLAKRSGDGRFAYDSYRRFIQMYSNVVLDVEHHHFEDILDNHKRDKSYNLDTDLSAEDWQAVIGDYKKAVERELGKPFPQDVQEQLWGAIGAVFGSWMSARAITYRKLHDIPAGRGIAAIVQTMVFGNMGDDCATGVAFTRNPSTGENAFYGEYLVNAQGEDVVTGIRKPQHLTVAGKIAGKSDLPAMEEVMPELFNQLNGVRLTLERHYRDMQDIEFTVQRNTPFILQTRNGKRTAPAALKIAVDMVGEGLISRDTAIGRISPEELTAVFKPQLAVDPALRPLAAGLPASEGAAAGHIVFSADDALEAAKSGRNVILVRIEINPEDVEGMKASAGILTSRGGMSSHAATKSREIGKPCVTGAGDLKIDYRTRTVKAGPLVLRCGDEISIDGNSGKIFHGSWPVVQPELAAPAATMLRWLKEYPVPRIRAVAHTATDAATAHARRSDGLGLCDIARMLEQREAVSLIPEAMLVRQATGPDSAPDRLRAFIRAELAGIFKVMRELPVAVRLFDGPLHAMLTEDDPGLADLARRIGRSELDVRATLSDLRRDPGGDTLCGLHPAIAEAQCQALFEAASEAEAAGAGVQLEVLLPPVLDDEHMHRMKGTVRRIAASVEAATSLPLQYRIGVSIDTPHAAFRAGALAKHVDVISIDLERLTRHVFGLSAGRSEEDFRNRIRAPKSDPFRSIDLHGVAPLLDIIRTRARAANSDIRFGVIGEHVCALESLVLLVGASLDHLTCDPETVPAVRLAAVHAHLRSALTAGKSGTEPDDRARASVTNATETKPCHGETQVKSANHKAFGHF